MPIRGLEQWKGLKNVNKELEQIARQSTKLAGAIRKELKTAIRRSPARNRCERAARATDLPSHNYRV